MKIGEVSLNIREIAWQILVGTRSTLRPCVNRNLVPRDVPKQQRRSNGRDYAQKSCRTNYYYNHLPQRESGTRRSQSKRKHAQQQTNNRPPCGESGKRQLIDSASALCKPNHSVEDHTDNEPRHRQRRQRIKVVLYRIAGQELRDHPYQHTKDCLCVGL
jgi:hypothetical protein